MLYSVLHLSRCFPVPPWCANDLKRVSLDPSNLPCLQKKHQEPSTFNEILLLFDSLANVFDIISFRMSEQFLLEEE
jgi:hypothetical protein